MELKPGGADIAVTEENRDEYIDLVIKHRFVDAIEEQMARFVVIRRAEASGGGNKGTATGLPACARETSHCFLTLVPVA